MNLPSSSYSLWWIALCDVITAHVAEVSLHGVSHLPTQVGQFNGLSSQLPLVPFVTFDNV